MDGRKKPTGSWTPTLFENELLNLDMELINSRPYHPQTNDKLELFHRSLGDEIWHYSNLSGYIEYYDTPLMAFHNKKATDNTRHQNPKWIEDDINGQQSRRGVT